MSLLFGARIFRNLLCITDKGRERVEPVRTRGEGGSIFRVFVRTWFMDDPLINKLLFCSCSILVYLNWKTSIISIRRLFVKNCCQLHYHCNFINNLLLKEPKD